MTVENYNDDRAFRAYIRRHFAHLLTPLERRVTEYDVPVVSDANDSKVRRLYDSLERRDGHVEDQDVVNAMQTPIEMRIENAVTRVIAERFEEIYQNRCPDCNRLARTPSAKQCLWCGCDWH